VAIDDDGLADLSGVTYIERHINDFFWESRSVDDWQLADERNNRERITRARQAAEELFKPAPPNPRDVKVPQSASNEGTPTDQPPRRQPRIFTVSPRLAPLPKTEPPVANPPARRGVAKPRKVTVPPSQIGRVRALATYGMTPRQVADLYGVATEEIDRILKTPA
jgi:hypothetical protein